VTVTPSNSTGRNRNTPPSPPLKTPSSTGSWRGKKRKKTHAATPSSTTSSRRSDKSPSDLVNIGGKGPAISYEGAHCMATDLFVRDRTTAEDCRDLARDHTPYERLSISSDPVTGRMQRIKKKGFLAGALHNAKPPHAAPNV
jgi:hypothetical protein